MRSRRWMHPRFARPIRHLWRLLPALFWWVAVSVPAEEDLFFRWNPPGGLCRVEETVSTRRVERPDVGVHVDRKVVRTQVAYRSEPAGYIYAATPLAYTSTRDGSPVEDLALAWFDKAPLTYHLDLAGRLGRIDGLSLVVERARAQWAANPAMKEIVSEENYSRQLTRQWEDRFCGLLGKRGRIGDTWRTSDQYRLVGKEGITYHTTGRLAEKLRVEGRDCVRVEFHYHSAAEPRSTTRETSFAPASGVRESEVSGWGELVVDPSTMLLYAERRQFIVRIKPGVFGPQPMTVVEERECTFEPAGAGGP